MHFEPSLPLTLDEHKELAVELRATNARLHELCNLVVSVYGPNAQAAFTFIKAAELVERLCHDMQAQAIEDCRGYPVEKLYA
jgi:hypothetical protein